MEKVQRSAIKYILNDYSRLHLLPLLMYWLEQDLMFLINCIKYPLSNFDISNHVKLMSSSIYKTLCVAHFTHLLFLRYTRYFCFKGIVPLHVELTCETSIYPFPVPGIKRHILKLLWRLFFSD